MANELPRTNDWLQAYCDDLTSLYGLPPVLALFDARTSTGGYYVVGDYRVVISPHMTDAGTIDVIRHELAHHRTHHLFGYPKVEAHGAEWKESARLMGAIPSPCAAETTPKLQQRRAACRARRRKA